MESASSEMAAPAGGSGGGHDMMSRGAPGGAIVGFIVAVLSGVLWVVAAATRRARGMRQALGGVAVLSLLYAGTAF
ncbi:MAG: hypothetical protein ACE5O2_16215, partial [Armatimonadota bacterium]